MLIAVKLIELISFSTSVTTFSDLSAIDSPNIQQQMRWSLRNVLVTLCIIFWLMLRKVEGENQIKRVKLDERAALESNFSGIHTITRIELITKEINSSLRKPN